MGKKSQSRHPSLFYRTAYIKKMVIWINTLRSLYLFHSLSLSFSLLLSFSISQVDCAASSSNSGRVILESVAEPGTGRRHSRVARGSDSCHVLPPEGPTDWSLYEVLYIYIKHTVKTLRQLGAARWHHQTTSYGTITVRTEHWVARSSVWGHQVALASVQSPERLRESKWLSVSLTWKFTPRSTEGMLGSTRIYTYIYIDIDTYINAYIH